MGGILDYVVDLPLFCLSTLKKFQRGSMVQSRLQRAAIDIRLLTSGHKNHSCRRTLAANSSF